jgi:uncharacterized protein YjbI with pentapeptide repeats
MANKDHFAILERGKDAWEQWRRRHPRITPDLSKAELHGSDLRKFNLQGVNLRAANLCSAHLSGGNFRQADLFGAALCQANLSRTTLYGANLFGANLWGADLQEANLTEANLYGANLRRVNASQAQFARAFCKRATLEGALLTDAYCGEVDLKDADITHKDLEKARQGNVLALTEISLLQDTFSQAAMDHLSNAVQAFMAACGFAYNGIIETTYCPFFQLVKFWSHHPCTVDKLEHMYEAGRQGLQHAFADQRDEISASNLGVVSTRLATALDPFTDIVLRLGELIVLKMTTQGQPHRCVACLSPALAHELAMHPSLLRHPAEAMPFAIKVHQLQREPAG